jgi:hypothetical protein
MKIVIDYLPLSFLLAVISLAAFEFTVKSIRRKK